MREYEKYIECEKCGTDRLPNVVYKNVLNDLYECALLEVVEYLEFTCNRCGFNWNTKCKANKELV